VPDALPFTLDSLISFGQDRWGRIFLTEGSGLYRLVDPNAIFVDGFETGDISAWIAPQPPL
jgi:hypothetical protein